MAGIAREVKIEILGKVKSGEKVVDLAAKYGVREKTIYNWLQGEVSERVSWKEHKRVLKENEDLKNILAVLTLEIEKTKKRSREIINKTLEAHPQTNKQLLAQIFGVCRRWLYQKTSLLQHKDEILKEQILSVLSEFPSYGYRRISVALGIGKKRVRRCMQLYGIKPYKRKARWRKRRDERRAHTCPSKASFCTSPLSWISSPERLWAGTSPTSTPKT